MKTYYYRRNNGIVVVIEAEQMFWSGTACVFVKAGLAAAVISLLPGEIVAERGIGQEVRLDEEIRKDIEKAKEKLN